MFGLQALEWKMNSTSLKLKIPAAAVGILITGSVLLFGCRSNQGFEKSARLIPLEALIGEWSGFSEEHGLYLMRLENGGSGFFAYMPYEGEPTVLRITDWRCKRKWLALVLSPIGQNPKGVEKVEGRAEWLDMKLTLLGSGWQREAVFHREDDRERRLGILKASVDVFKTNTPASPKQN